MYHVMRTSEYAEARAPQTRPHSPITITLERTTLSKPSDSSGHSFWSHTCNTEGRGNHDCSCTKICQKSLSKSSYLSRQAGRMSPKNTTYSTAHPFEVHVAKSCTRYHRTLVTLGKSKIRALSQLPVACPQENHTAAHSFEGLSPQSYLRK